MYDNPRHKAHTHTPDKHGGSGDPWLYDNGCILCDAQQVIRDYVLDESFVPAWLPAEQGEREAQQDVVNQIRVIMQAHGLPGTARYRAALAETYGSPTHEFPG